VTDTARLEKAVFDAIFDPGAEVGMKHDRSLTEWQTDAVINVLTRLLLDELDASKARRDDVIEEVAKLIAGLRDDSRAEPMGFTEIATRIRALKASRSDTVGPEPAALSSSEHI
jgi:hypothetical protein